MKRWYWIGVAAAVVVAAGVTLVALPRAPEWTTSSPEALAEFEAGLIEFRKVYYEEAWGHFEKAYELDPEFLVAKLRVAWILREEDPDHAEALFGELRTANLGHLTVRERCLIEYWLALNDEEHEEAIRLLEQCVERLPNDPNILEIKAGVAWRQGDLEDADRLNKALLAVDPNWVTAYNSLGYIKMEQAHFTEAEEHFKKYRYIVPDQANPHDSLGELYTTVGRYKEAETTLEQAIEIKPDFWPSYLHLALVKALERDFESLHRIIDRARDEGIAEGVVFEMSCTARSWELADRAAWREILNDRTSECVEKFKLGWPSLIAHRAACQLGDWEAAQKLEDDAAGALLEVEGSGNADAILEAQAATLHMQGVRLATQGEFGAAVERFRAVADRLSFMKVEQGMFKLHNQLLESETLLAAGKDSDAHKVIAHVRGINPELVGEFEDTRFRYLGLGRGDAPIETATKEEKAGGTMTAM